MAYIGLSSEFRFNFGSGLDRRVTYKQRTAMSNSLLSYSGECDVVRLAVCKECRIVRDGIECWVALSRASTAD